MCLPGFLDGLGSGWVLSGLLLLLLVHPYQPSLEHHSGSATLCLMRVRSPVLSYGTVAAYLCHLWLIVLFLRRLCGLWVQPTTLYM